MNKDIKSMRDLADFALEAAASTINKAGGEVIPIFLGWTESKEMLVIATPFSSDKEKQAVALAVTTLFKNKGVTMYCFSAEAWASSYARVEGESNGDTEKRIAKLGRPSTQADRKEIITIITGDKQGNSILGTAEIVASADGGRRLMPAEFTESSNPKDVGGLFANLLIEDKP